MYACKQKWTVMLIIFILKPFIIAFDFWKYLFDSELLIFDNLS